MQSLSVGLGFFISALMCTDPGEIWMFWPCWSLWVDFLFV